MARKKSDGRVVSLKPVPITKKFIQPLSIAEDFVSYVCFKHMEMEQITDEGKKQKVERVTERLPIMLVWNGKELTYNLCRKGQDVKINDRNYIIDRDIDDNPFLPTEQFVTKLMNPPMLQKMLNDFDPVDYFNLILSYYERYFFMEKPYLYRIISLFCANIWVFDAHTSTPYLHIHSPQKGCAKTHVGISITQMANGEMSVNFKAHHLFRAVHGTKSTAVFDEVKKWTQSESKLSEDTLDILSLVNVGFQAEGSKVPRLVEGAPGEDMKRILFDSYCPKAIITTYGILPSDTVSRCIDLTLQKAPKEGADYGERWYEPERVSRLETIREMGLLFRLKYGSEIYKISRNPKWRDELDISHQFGEIRNRDLEIFRPLVILVLKFMPEWKEFIKTYIDKFVESRNKLEFTPVNSILIALKALYHEVDKAINHALQYEWGGEISLDDDPLHGMIMSMPIKAIEFKVQAQSDINVLGSKNPAIVIGKILNDLGFITGNKTTRYGKVRMIKVTQLKDMCARYLGEALGTEADEHEMSQAERHDFIREALISAGQPGIEYNELYVKVCGRVTTEQLQAILIHFRERGLVQAIGKRFKWVKLT